MKTDEKDDRASIFWCNGEWLDDGRAPLSATDRGATLGLALFGTLLAVDGKPKFFAEQMARLEEGCAKLGWEISLEDLEKAMGDLLARNDLLEGNARIRMTVTAGSGNHNDIRRGGDAVVWMVATEIAPSPDSLAVTISPWKRNERSPLAGLKCCSYAENLVALDHARKAGFDETIFFNASDRLCEAATTNVFLVRDGRVLTPSLDSGCLPGVARAVVIRLAQKHGLVCKETPLEMGDLQNADEIFLTSAIRGPVPVSRLDGRHFANTPVARRVQDFWKEEIARD